jgi:hypothetical protein
MVEAHSAHLATTHRITAQTSSTLHRRRTSMTWNAPAAFELESGSLNLFKAEDGLVK